VKITFVTPFYLPEIGGTQTVVREMATRLAERGHQVSVVAPGQRGHTVEEGVAVHRLPQLQPSPLGYTLMQLRILTLLRDSDVVHQFHQAYGLASLLARRWWGHPLVITLIGYDTYDFARMPWVKRRITLAASEAADRVVATSEDMRSKAHELGTKRPIEVIACGVTMRRPDPAQVAGLRDKLDLQAGSPVFISVQRLHSVKGPDTLLDAWAALPYRLLVVGGGELEAQLRHRVQKEGLVQVTMVGEVDPQTLPNYYALADVQIHHTHYEAFGMSVVEGMASGLPIIATRVGALPDLIRDGETGLLVPPGDAAALADAVRQLARDEALREAMGNLARSAATSFAWPAVIDRYLALYAAAIVEAGREQR